MKCPVCEIELSESNLNFCEQCSWDLKNDPTIVPSIEEIPDELKEEYKKRLEIAKENWRKVLEARKKLEKEREDVKEDRFWNECKRRNTLSAYREYLGCYPNGRHITEAAEAIKVFERNEKQEAEERLWKDVLKEDNRKGYERFLQSFPDGKYAETARLILKKIEKEENKPLKDNRLDESKMSRNILQGDRFLLIGEDSVFDKKTGLMWARKVGPSLSYYAAEEWVQEIELSGYDDWRIPKMYELFSLYESKEGPPYLPKNHPFKNIPEKGSIWSSSKTEGKREILNFFESYYDASNKREMQITSQWVWPVRGKMSKIKWFKSYISYLRWQFFNLYLLIFLSPVIAILILLIVEWVINKFWK